MNKKGIKLYIMKQKLSKKNYPTTEKEYLVVIWIIQKFKNFLKEK